MRVGNTPDAMKHREERPGRCVTVLKKHRGARRPWKQAVAQPTTRKFFVVLTKLFMGEAVELRISLGLVDLSRTPSGFFFREVHPGSEMASQNDQNKAK